MDALEQARREIDTIDKQMAALFCRRMEQAGRVAAYKQAHGLPVLNEQREEEVVRRNTAALPQPELAEYYEDFVRSNMRISRCYQQKLLAQNAVAFQGVEGAFSHIAAKRMFPHGQLTACASWEDVFTAVESGQVTAGVLPFENSQAGDVAEVLDLCFAHRCCVQAMVDLPVRQNLLGTAGAAVTDVREVYSHPQALSQCAQYLKTLPVKTVPTDNTAGAAKAVAQAGDKTKAAIASRETAALYGLEVLAENINTANDNTTRFIIIGSALRESGTRFSLLFTVRHVAGSLARVIQALAALGYNMECIKSRPMPHTPWEYYFYVEIEGAPDRAARQALLDKLAEICTTVRLLGVYNKQTIEEQV